MSKSAQAEFNEAILGLLGVTTEALGLVKKSDAVEPEEPTEADLVVGDLDAIVEQIEQHIGEAPSESNALRSAAIFGSASLAAVATSQVEAAVSGSRAGDVTGAQLEHAVTSSIALLMLFLVAKRREDAIEAA